MIFDPQKKSTIFPLSHGENQIFAYNCEKSLGIWDRDESKQIVKPMIFVRTNREKVSNVL